MNNPEKRKILVVGAGIAGLTAGYLLSESGVPVTVIEKEERVGGLARTFRYGDYAFDIGPHRFYSSQNEIMNFIFSVLDEEYLEVLRFSAVYYCNQYHTWPLRLRSIFQMPLTISVPAFLDLFTKGKYRKLEEPSFKNFILAKYGKTLYETFFKGYTEKFLGLSPEDVHFHWAKMGVERATIDTKIKTGSISQLLRLMLMPSPKQLNFIYPKGGCDVFCEKLREKIEKNGGKVITGQSPDAVEHNGKNITKITAGGVSYEPDTVIWTAPVTELMELMGYEQPGLDYLALTLYNLELKEPPKQEFQWCYFGSPELAFSRATNPAMFDADTVPKGKGGLCVEVTCREGDKVWSSPGAFNDSLVRELAGARAINGKNSVIDIHTETIPNTYPVYDINYLDKLAVVREKLQQVTNLFLAGRTGLFWYNNMDHSIENAMDVVDRVLGHTPENADERLKDPYHLGAMVGEPCLETAV